MKIQILALPNKKVSGAGIDIIDPTTTSRQILDKIKTTYPSLISVDRDLIVDKSASIPRITINDPVNEYFNGRSGDIYRIVDFTATRFRMVSGMSVINKTKTSPFHEVTHTMYYSAYNTVLDMIKDRRDEGDEDSEVDKSRITPDAMSEIFSTEDMSKLNIKGIKNRRGQDIYVEFINKDDTHLLSNKRSSGNKGLFRNKLTEIIETVVKDYNDRHQDQKLEVPNITLDKDPNIIDFMDKIELIIVYNNQNNEHIVKVPEFMPCQFFAVQQLVFNVTKHVDQPTFYLLDTTKDRAEILDVLSLNGLVLEKDKPLSEYNIKEGTRLILI